ncbi:MAG: hypothetical protein ABIY52_17195 [Gemmatimonadaceae bacterium]
MFNSRLRPFVFVAGLVLGAGCRSPKADAAIAEQMQQMGDELNAVRQDNAATVEQLDSLRVIVAKQDTILHRLSDMANVPYPAH